MIKSRNRTYCCVFGCINNNSMIPDLSLFSVPNEPERRVQWLKLIGREDIVNATYSYRVCEEHFRPDEILLKATRKILKRNAIPSLRLPNTTAVTSNDHNAQVNEGEICNQLENDIENYTRWKLMGGTLRVKRDVVPHIFECQTKKKAGKHNKTKFQRKKITQETSHEETDEAQKSPEREIEVTIKQDIEDSEVTVKQDIKDAEVTVKQEIEDSFSEHEEDIMEQLENRKRMNQTPQHVPAKMMKQDPLEVLTVDIERERYDKPTFPVDFMKTVLSSQTEILTILKSQVLLQDPDADLMKFLRLMGAKLQRLNPAQRKNMQDAIIDLMNTQL